MAKQSYSLKQALAGRLARKHGIDPAVTMAAGDAAAPVIDSLSRASATAGKERNKYIAEAQRGLRRLDAKQHATLINAVQAKLLALQGRGGDTEIAHVTPGEMVIPSGLLTPEITNLIAAEAAKRGIDPDKFIVGGQKASVNPQTEVEQFNSAEQLEFGPDWKPVTVLRRPINADPRDEAAWYRENVALDTAFGLADKWEEARAGEKFKVHEGPEGTATGPYGVTGDYYPVSSIGQAVPENVAKQRFYDRYADERKKLDDPRVNDLTGPQLGAAMSLGLNTGMGRLKESNTYQAMLNGEDAVLSREWSEFRMYTPKGKTEKEYSNGLENRRGDELDIYHGRERLRQPGDKPILPIPGGSPRRR